MTIDLRREVAEGLETLASSQGLSVKEYLQRLVARELPAAMIDAPACHASGMVWEDGLLIYGAGSSLPAGFVDKALKRSREERTQHLLA